MCTESFHRRNERKEAGLLDFSWTDIPITASRMLSSLNRRRQNGRHQTSVRRNAIFRATDEVLLPTMSATATACSVTNTLPLRCHCHQTWSRHRHGQDTLPLGWHSHKRELHHRTSKRGSPESRRRRRHHQLITCLGVSQH